MERRRATKIAIASITVLVVLSLVQLGRNIGNAVSTARNFRKHPSESVAYTLLKGTSFSDYIAREVMFYPGSSSYESDFRNWVYQPSSMANTWWNRSLIARDAARMDSSDREQFLPYSPVSLNGSVLSLIVTDLDHGHTWELSALGLANNNTTGERLCSQWVQRHLLTTENRKLFVTAAPGILKCSYSHMTVLFQRYWPELKPSQQDTLLEDVADNLQRNSQAADDFFTWFKTALSTGDLRNLPNTTAVLADFIRFDRQRHDATLLITQEAGELAPSHIYHLLDLIDTDEERANDHFATGEPPHSSSYLASGTANVLANELIDNFAHVKPQVALAAFRYVANQDVHQAERIARPVLDGPDSELRKGEIVILVDNDSVLGRRHIDEAFRGTAPRRTMFRSWFDYIDSSRAADLYKKLARHDYLETGKTWPPSTTKAPLRFDDVEDWREFIKLYPWFPGTDDAYYRMIFSEYMSHDFIHAIQDTSEYLHRELPDRDADPYVYYTLAQIARKPDSPDANVPVISNLRTILRFPVALMLFEPHPDTTSLSQALAWFLSHKDYIPCLMMNEKQLLIRRKLVALIGSTPFPERLVRVDKMLESEFERTGTHGVYEILYGPSFAVRIKGTRGYEPSYPISTSVMQSAGRLTDGMIRTRANTGQGYTQTTRAGITWALLHSQISMYGNLSASFAASFRSLRQIDPDRLPDPLRTRVRQFKQYLY